MTISVKDASGASQTVKTIDDLISAGLLAKVGDGTNNVAVKAASTAPSATDPALVVAISPNGTNANQTTDYAKSVGAAPVMLPQDQVIPVKASTVTNGTTKTRIVSAASTNATSVKASAGKVMSLRLFNNAAYDVFFKFYDKASSPTVGTDTPTWTIPIKAGTGYSDHFPLGDDFGTGIAYAITKLQADSDTTAVAAGDVTGKMHWI